MRTRATAVVLAIALLGVFAVTWPGSARAAEVPAASCSGAHVQAAVDAARDGDRVVVPGGDCSWPDPVRLDNARGVTLACAAPRACRITPTDSAVLFDTMSGQNGRLYRITGFDFATPDVASIIWIAGNGTLSRLRIDDNRFVSDGESIAILFGTTETVGNYYGVVDHNHLTGAASSTLVQIIGATNPSPPPSQLGSANNLFVEDNTVSFPLMTNAGKGCLDSWGNGAIVWRHNVTLNCLVASHGVTHSGGPQNLELYANALGVDGGSMAQGVANGYRLFHHQGSGTIVAFDNRFTAFAGKSGSALEVTHYRSATPAAAGYPDALGRCDGTDAKDGNRPPTPTYYGYPCWHQPGRDFAGNLVPIYAWNNAWSDTGAQVEFTVADPWGASAPSVLDHIKPDRDYYDAVSAAAQTSPTAPFAGSTGTGYGTLANRPTACATNALERGGGVGYYATDAAILYQCSATNTWTPWYAPYLYPHPLVSGKPAPPPVTPPPPPTGPPGGAGVRCDGRAATIVGTARGDRLVGTRGRDVIVGLGGADVLLGMGGNDLICGGGGADLIRGGRGADRLLGGGGDDRLVGEAGADRLVGGRGRDHLTGGAGRDRCVGGPGRDRAGGCELRATIR